MAGESGSRRAADARRGGFGFGDEFGGGCGEKGAESAVDGELTLSSLDGLSIQDRCDHAVPCAQSHALYRLPCCALSLLMPLLFSENVDVGKLQSGKNAHVDDGSTQVKNLRNNTAAGARTTATRDDEDGVVGTEDGATTATVVRTSPQTKSSHAVFVCFDWDCTITVSTRNCFELLRTCTRITLGPRAESHVCISRWQVRHMSKTLRTPDQATASAFSLWCTEHDIKLPG